MRVTLSSASRRVSARPFDLPDGERMRAYPFGRVLPPASTTEEGY